MSDIDPDNFFVSIQFWVLVLAVMLLPIIFKKEIHELKIVSMMLFLFLLAFLIILFVQGCLYPAATFVEKERAVTFLDQLTPLDHLTFKDAVTSINTASFSLSITSNVFPTYSSLRVKTTANMTKSLVLGLVMTVGVYTLYSVTCVILFGLSLSDTEGNSLDNIG